MNVRIFILLPAVLLTTGWVVAEDDAPLVKIYLPRQKIVAGPSITLDDIAMVTGEDACARRARGLKLGRAPLPGETIVLKRNTIRARLASEKLFEEDISMIGATEVAVKRNVSLIQPVELINLAETFLQTHLPSKSFSWKLARKPKSLTLPESSKAELKCHSDEKAPSGHVRVIIEAVAGEKVLETRQVLFQLKYRSQQVVATCEIRPGEIITPDNAQIERIEVARKPERWISPFGATARKTIQAGAVISEKLIRRPKPRVTVRRNQTVRIKLAGSGWCITALGTAMQNGVTDDIIAVRNIDSRKVIQARVDEDGDVIPLTPGR
ncbi:MAG: flagellar basal body P-ring formation protein FlgA [Phycisphaerae bacterium]|nr:flagellar basal body P-ring formation protein FlgA [Phycisphaerae bacterium]